MTDPEPTSLYSVKSRNGWCCACSTPTGIESRLALPQVDGFVWQGFLPDVQPGQRYRSVPYTTGPLARQYLLTLRTIVKPALPERFLRATSDETPEAASEDKCRGLMERLGRIGAGNPIARRRGRATAIRNRSNRLSQRHTSASRPVPTSPR